MIGADIPQAAGLFFLELASKLAMTSTNGSSYYDIKKKTCNEELKWIARIDSKDYNSANYIKIINIKYCKLTHDCAPKDSLRFDKLDVKSN